MHDQEIRLETIQNNKNLESFRNTDKYIEHMDAPQIIEYILNWHIQDREHNKFDGELFDKSDDEYTINLLSEIGQVTTVQAMNIYNKLKNEIVINVSEWLELPQPKLKLKTITYCRLVGGGPKTVDDISIDNMITLLTYTNLDPDAWKPEDPDFDYKENKREILRGVFQQVKWSNNFKYSHRRPKPSALETSVLINGGNAIRKSECDLFDRDHCCNAYVESFKWKVQNSQRWEQLIVDFFRGKPRKYEYDGEFDIPDQTEDRWFKVYHGTSPKELAAKGRLTEHKYGPYDGDKFQSKSVKEMVQECMNYLIHPSVLNAKRKPFNTKLRGGVNQIFRELKKC